MRRVLEGVNLELAAAVRRCNAIHSQIPPERRPDLSGESWHELERELDRACGAGDRAGATRAIDRWERHARTVLTSAKVAAESGADRAVSAPSAAAGKLDPSPVPIGTTAEPGSRAPTSRRRRRSTFGGDPAGALPTARPPSIAPTAGEGAGTEPDPTTRKDASCPNRCS